MIDFTTSNSFLLSICIPTFNRADLLERLIESICSAGENAALKKIEIVIVDDGSTDKTAAIISAYQLEKKLNIVYHKQENSGRGVALINAIKIARGKFVMLLDSDDLFVRGSISYILKNLDKIQEDGSLIGAVFSTLIINLDGTKQKNSLIEGMVCNLIELIADYGYKKDLKQTVRREILSLVIQRRGCVERRIPTYLWWAQTVEYGNVECFSDPVVIKEYQENGMTANISRLKMQNPKSMFDLYKYLACSPHYKSLMYRVRAYIAWGYYAALSRNLRTIPWFLKILIPVYLISITFKKIKNA